MGRRSQNDESPMGLLNDIMNNNLGNEDSLEGEDRHSRNKVVNRISTTSFAGKNEG